jgi:ABC-type lipoprotein release transport system permease subunit
MIMDSTEVKQHRCPKLFCFNNERGQSTIEYLIVTGILVMALITMPSIYATISHTMQNKYKSYCFGVAISDPPRKAFDDAINQDADKVQEVLNAFDELADFMKNVIVPDIVNLRLPSEKELDDFLQLLKKLF